MRKSLYTFDVADYPDGTSTVCYQCVKCDFHTSEQHLILGHLSSEHLSAKKKPKPTSYCSICGMTVVGCSKLGQCLESKKRNLENIIKIVDTHGIIP